ncbi:MAG: C39 family peptidase [Syntrophomonas sp.]
MIKVKRIVGTGMALICLMSMLTAPVFGESLKDLGLSESYFNKSDLNKAYPDGDPRINNDLGALTPEQEQAGKEKSEIATKVINIREKAIKNPQSVTKNDTEIVQSYINKYFKGQDIKAFIPNITVNKDNSISVVSSNPGDYQTKFLNLPGQVQTNNYYCGPATAYAILNGRGINVSQTTMASRLDTDTDGTNLANFPAALNYYSGTNGNYFSYALSYGPGSYSTTWAVNMTNNAISTLLGNYGVVYDVHMINVSGSARLQGYETMQAPEIKHYVAGEGFDSSDPSNRICNYYDSNNQKSNLGDRHMQVSFQTMARLTDDMGIAF